MKTIIKFIKNLLPARAKRAFYILVRCSDCGEEVKVRIDHSSDFQLEYNAQNPEHCYTLKKEIIGKKCFNLMSLTLGLTRDAKVLFADAKACDFIEFDKE